MKKVLILLALILPAAGAKADGIDLKSGDYYMVMDSGNIVNLDTGEYYINMGNDTSASSIPNRDRINIPLPLTPSSEEDPPLDPSASTGDYYMQVDEGILNLTTGDCFMKLE